MNRNNNHLDWCRKCERFPCIRYMMRDWQNCDVPKRTRKYVYVKGVKEFDGSC